MTIIKLNNRFITVPTEWNELSQKQLLEVMDCLFVRGYTGNQVLVKLFKIITNQTYFQFFRTSVLDIEEYLYLTLFLISDRTTITRQLLPEYKGFYGPASNFDNLVMQEMALADAYFMRWAQDRENTDLLTDFCALLYRKPKKWYNHGKNPDGDPRQEFNQNICAWHAKHSIRKWPINVKLAIAYWYDACRWEIVEEFDEIFGGDGSGDVAKYGLLSMMMSVAETHALGDLSRIEKHYVKTVLMHMNDSIAKAKQQEKAMKA